MFLPRRYYLFKVNNGNSRAIYWICSKFIIKAAEWRLDVVLCCLYCLTLNIFQTLIWWLNCWFWKNKMPNGLTHSRPMPYEAVDWFLRDKNVYLNPLSPNSRKWTNTLKQFVSNFHTARFFKNVWPFCCRILEKHCSKRK